MHFFISYKEGKANNLAAYVKEIFDEAFSDRPVEIFYAKDKNSLQMGSNWHKVIWNALFKSDCFIIIVDEDWISGIADGKAGYALLEAEYAMAHNYGNNVYIIPVSSNDQTKLYDAKILNINDFQDQINRFQDNILKTSVNHTQYREGATLLDYLNHIINIIIRDLPNILKWRPFPVLFISSVIADSSSNSHFEYFGTITRLLAMELSKHHKWPIDCVIKVTPSDFPQTLIIEDAISKKDYYRAIIIAPYETKESGETIIEYFKSHHSKHNCPIFTIDKTYHQSKAFKQNTDITPPCGVMNDWKHGGEAAAKIFMRYLKVLGVSQPRLFLVDGLEGGKERIDAFHNKLLSTYNNCLFWHINGNFSRVTAKNKFLEVLTDSNILPGDIHGVFCANDEMALGVRDAIIYWQDNNNDILGIVVVGYDGIDRIKQYIDKNDLYILNTIDVDLQKQVIQLTNCVMETLRGNRLVENKYPHKIQGYPHQKGVDAQIAHITNILDNFYKDDLKKKLTEKREAMHGLDEYIYNLISDYTTDV